MPGRIDPLIREALAEGRVADVWHIVDQAARGQPSAPAFRARAAKRVPYLLWRALPGDVGAQLDDAAVHRVTLALFSHDAEAWRASLRALDGTGEVLALLETPCRAQGPSSKQ